MRHIPADDPSHRTRLHLPKCISSRSAQRRCTEAEILAYPSACTGKADEQLRALRDPFVSAYDIPKDRIEQLTRRADEPRYKAPSLSTEALETVTRHQERLKQEGHGDKTLHVGSCHCQKVVFAYLGGPVRESRTGACLCSICYGVSHSQFSYLDLQVVHSG